MRLIRRFAQDETGATAIEYGLIAALIAVSCIAAFATAGNAVFNLFGHVADKAVPALGG